MVGPLGKVVDEKRATWLNDPDAFIHPRVAPLQIVAASEIVLVAAVSVILRKIERRIGKNTVDRFVLQVGEQIQAIRLMDRSEISAKGRGKMLGHSTFLRGE